MREFLELLVGKKTKKLHYVDIVLGIMENKLTTLNNLE